MKRILYCIFLLLFSASCQSKKQLVSNQPFQFDYIKIPKYETDKTLIIDSSEIKYSPLFWEIAEQILSTADVYGDGKEHTEGVFGHTLYSLLYEKYRNELSTQEKLEILFLFTECFIKEHYYFASYVENGLIHKKPEVMEDPILLLPLLKLEKTGNSIPQFIRETQQFKTPLKYVAYVKYCLMVIDNESSFQDVKLKSDATHLLATAKHNYETSNPLTVIHFNQLISGRFNKDAFIALKQQLTGKTDREINQIYNSIRENYRKEKHMH